MALIKMQLTDSSQFVLRGVVFLEFYGILMNMAILKVSFSSLIIQLLPVLATSMCLGYLYLYNTLHQDIDE